MENIEKIADLMGAKLVAKVDNTGGAFGADKLAHDINDIQKHEDLQCRIEIAYNFLINHMIDDIDMFYPKRETANQFNQLAAILSIFSARNYLSVNHDSPIKALSSIENNICTRNKSNFLMDTDGSSSVCNALLYLIKYKQHYVDSQLFANGLIECINDKISKFVPGTGDQQFVADHPGLIVIALLNAYSVAKEEKYLDAADRACKMICSYNKLSSYNAWAIAMMSVVSDDPLYETHFGKLLTTIDIRPEVMAGVIIPMSLQIYLAWKYMQEKRGKHIAPWVNNRIDDLTEILKTMQINVPNKYNSHPDCLGAFVKEPSDTTIRLDYVFHSLNAMLQIAQFDLIQENTLPF